MEREDGSEGVVEYWSREWGDIGIRPGIGRAPHRLEPTGKWDWMKTPEMQGLCWRLNTL